MLTKELIDKFWSDRQGVADPVEAARWRHSEAGDHDMALITEHVGEDSAVLDLGAGTGVLTKPLLPKVRRVVAVEKQEAFLQSIPDSPKLEKVCADVGEFEWGEKDFDCVLLFGVANYLTDDDLDNLLGRIADHWLKEGGVFIAKHQSGMKENVVVNDFSEALGMHYHAIYRFCETDLEILKRFFTDVQRVDIYPDHLNKWENTRNYAYVCRR